MPHLGSAEHRSESTRILSEIPTGSDVVQGLLAGQRLSGHINLNNRGICHP